MNAISDGVIEEITKRLISSLSPDKIILFGSHAWGVPNEDSDVDLLVVVPESTLSPSRRASLAYRALRGISLPIDVLVKTRDEVERLRHVRASLESQVLERGRVLYG